MVSLCVAWLHSDHPVIKDLLFFSGVLTLHGENSNNLVPVGERCDWHFNLIAHPAGPDCHSLKTKGCGAWHLAILASLGVAI